MKTSNKTFQSFKEKTKSVVREASKGSCFESWSSDSLKNLLIEYNVQVRGSKQASRSTLVRICEELFEGEFHGDEQDFRRVYTMEEMLLMDKAARTIQWLYIEYRRKRSQPQKLSNIVIDVMKSNGNGLEHYTVQKRGGEPSYYDEGGVHLDQIQMDDEYDEENKIYDENMISYEQSEEEDEFSKRRGVVDSDIIDATERSHKLEREDVMTASYDEENAWDDSNSHNHYHEQMSTDDHHRSEDTEAVETKPRKRRSRKRNELHSTRKPSKLDQELDTQWTKPSWKLAKIFEAENRPHRSGKEMKPYHWREVTLGRHCTIGGCGEQLDLWDEGQMSEFAQFGSGISNYFKFLKWCNWIMFILSIIHIPILVLNVLGTTMMNDGSILALATLGNLGASNIDYIQIPGCDNTKYQFEQCRLSKNELAILYAVLDAIGTIIVIMGYYWLKQFEQNEVDHLNRTTVTASDYTLRVSRIPVNITEREIAAHFAELTSSPIADVNIAFQNSNEIKLYMNRGQVMKQRNDCIHQIRYEQSCGGKLKGGKSASLKRVKKLLRERKKLTSLLDVKDAERSIKINSKPDALQAFVTFDSEEGFVKGISAYQMNWVRSISFFYPKHLRIGGAKVRVDQAPEPSTIIWENIEVKERSRFCRKCLTTCIASFAILLSIYFTFVARDFKIETLKSMSGECPTYFNDLTQDEQYDLVEEDITLSHCFCEVLEAQDQLEEPLCREFLKNKIRASSMSYGAGFMVCFMNIFFTILMDRAGAFEKHQSLDDMESSNMTRLFLLKFLNTGCLVLLYSLKFVQSLVGVNFGDPQNFNIDWYETGAAGMMIVMVINIFTPHIGSLLSYCSYKKRIRKMERNLDKDMETKDEDNIWYTQDDLNAVYLGPPFRLNYRYTQLLVNFYICWMYAVCMPLLPVIGAISFFVSYWVDKFLFCNFYRIPPNYSDAIGSRSTTLIGYSILFHIFMSCWILGNNQIFSGVSIVKNRQIDVFVRITFTDIILKRHIVILEIVAIVFILNILLKKFIKTFGATFAKLLRCIMCMKGNKVKKLKATMNAVQVTYGGARARGVIKGLASYNILQNPKYQEAFAITPEFAQKHKRISAIRGYNTKEKEKYDSCSYDSNVSSITD